VFCFEGAHQFAVGGDGCVFERSNSGIDFYIPQTAVITFFVATVRESMASGVNNGFKRLLFFCASSKTIPFGLGKRILT
jgi:hypothetical protein